MFRKIQQITRYPEFVRLMWWRHITPHFTRKTGLTLDHGVIFYGNPIVALAENSKISVGKRTILCSDSRYTALGVNHAVVLKTLRPDAVIRIGADTGISGASVCAAIEIVIGNNCLLGANVMIVDTDFHPIKPSGRRYSKSTADIAASPVRIGDNVFIGANAIVLKGVTIGENAVIGAGSVVVKNVPPNSIFAGNPARAVRTQI